MRIEQVKKNYDIEVRWIAFPLHPETPEEGLTLAELFAGKSIDIEKVRERLWQVANELGLLWGERRKIFNSRLAQELAKWAESKGKGDPYNQAIFRAYFVDVINIGKVDELVGLAKSIGLPEKEARSILELRPFKEAVDSDWLRSHALGIDREIGEQSAIHHPMPYQITPSISAPFLPPDHLLPGKRATHRHAHCPDSWEGWHGAMIKHQHLFTGKIRSNHR